MTFLTDSLPALAHWVLLIGEVADIVEPEELREIVLGKLERTKRRLSLKVS